MDKNDQIAKDVPQNVRKKVEKQAAKSGDNVVSIDLYTKSKKEHVYRAIVQDPVTGDTDYIDVAESIK